MRSNKFCDWHLYALLALMAAFIILKAPMIENYPEWDEAVYIGMGKYLYSSGESGLLESIRPVGLPLISGLWWSLGLDQLLASRIFSLLVSICVILLTYLLGKNLFGKNAGLLAAAILAISPIFFYYSHYVHVDHISALLLLLASYFLMREKPVLAGIFSGLAFFFKFTNALVIAAIFALTLPSIIRNDKLSMASRSKQKQLAIAGAISALMIVIYLALNTVLYSDHVGVANSAFKPLIDASAYQDNPYQNQRADNFLDTVNYLAYYPSVIVTHKVWGFALFMLALIYPFVRHKTHPNEGLIFAFILVFLAYFTLIPYKSERFAVYLLSFIAIYSAQAFILTWNRTGKYRAVIRTLLALFTIASIAIVMLKIAPLYNWYDDSTLNLNVERYFDQRPPGGPVLTTDPKISVHSDISYIPAYDVLNKEGFFVNSWEEKSDFAGVVYNNATIQCRQLDVRCMVNKQELLDFIEQNFDEKDSYLYNDANITFYTRKIH